MPLTPADLAPVRELYLQGRYRQALAAGERFGPVAGWAGPAGRLLGGRLAIQLGGPRLGRRLHLLAFRESPAYPEAVYYHARYRLERFGPLSCWRFQQQHPDWSDAPPELRADWLAVTALCAARVRDFDRAEKYLAQAEALAPGRPWVRVERASVLEIADRPADALAAAREALELHPWFRPAVQATGHLLRRAGREQEAVEFLTEADRHLESGIVAAQLTGLLLDLGRPADADRALDRYAELSPLLEPETRKWLHARRSDVAYLLGDPDRAAAEARQVGEDFYTKFADALASREGERPGGAPATPSHPLPAPPVAHPPGPARTLLRIPAPNAPHAALASFWHAPVPAPSGDAAPAFDGLPDPADRRRWEAAGFAVREFALTPDASAKLVAAGLPFLVWFVEAGFQQPRLVVGADPLRGTVFLADGPEGRPTEAPVSVLTERYKAFGPRCLVAAPADKLAAVGPLPQADEYDRLHAIQAALAGRKFGLAEALVAQLRADYPDHRLTRFAEVAWARATAHPVKLLAALDHLLTDFPGEPNLTLGKAAVLRQLGRNDDRQAILGEAAAKPDADPLVLQSYAQTLLPDPAARLEADRLLRRSVRVRPQAPAGYFLLATQAWERQRFAEAVELYRWAACLDDQEGQFAESFSKAAAAVGQAPEALRLFQQKAARGPAPNPAAVKALAEALLDRDEPEQALAAVNKAVEKQSAEPTPALGELLLFRAELHANAGRFDAADSDLAAAKPHTPPGTWLRAAARTARLKPDYAAALEHLNALLALDPLNAEAHRLVAGLTADTRGRAAARTYLADLAQKYPSVYPLARLRAEFLYPDGDDATEAATRRLVELCPADAWAWRQLALVHADRREHGQALAAITRAGEIEPDHPSQFAVLAHVHRRADRTDDALAAFRAGIANHPDHDIMVFEYVGLCRNRQEKADALRFVADQLRSRPHAGDGLLAYFEQSVRLVDDPEDQEKLVAEVDRFLDERPDLWQAWSLAVQSRLMTQRADEGLALAQEAADRFPLVARVWVDLAEARRAAGNPDDRLDALRRAAAIAPGWVPAARELASALEEAGHTEEATAVLERLVTRNPADPLAHWVLAEHLWQQDRGREAVDRAKRAVRLDPGHDPRADTAWAAVMAWTDRIDCPEEAVELARALTRDRAGDPRAWLRLARCLTDPGQMPEALEALEKAVALDPRNVEAHDQKAERLAAMGRYDEALAAARPPELSAELPLVLQGRAAWVEARRGNYAAAIPPMQALVSVDPEYVWGWQQLAEWYNETNRPENYLEAASELVRLRPEHPMSLTMRGEAKLQTGDRAGGKQDLRDALRIHPGYSPAAVVLFDACLADDEHREARAALAVLQEHLTGPEVLVKQLQYAARTDDEAAAARTFADLCQTPGDAPPLFLQMALTEMHAAGLADKAAELMKDAWQAGGEFHPWAGIYWLDTPDGEAAPAEQKLAACDAVIAAYPKFIPGYDRRAEQLALLGRFAEADEACKPAALGNPPPVALQGRAAWVEARRGDRAKAIAAMKQVVGQEPDYAWGWRQLTQWYDATGRHRDCLHAADQLVRLSPKDPVALAIRGEAKRVLGDHRGARDDFQKAFDLDPSFEAAGLQLISAQLTTDDLDGAARTLGLLREHGDGALVTLRAVQVASRQGDLATARSGFRELTRDAFAVRPVLRDAISALEAAGWRAEADEELDFAVGDPACSPAAAGLWVERVAATSNPGRAADRLPEIIERSRDGGREAVLTYAGVLAAAGRSADATATVQRFADLLREEDDGWARAGGVLAEVGNYALAAAWLADWQDRPRARAWMLRPLADSLRALDRDGEAQLVARAALALGPADEVPADFRAWLALGAAVAGDTADASQHLAAVDPLGLPDGVKLVLAMAAAVVMVRQAGPGGKGRAFAEAKEHLRTAAGACAPGDVPPGAGRWYKRVVARLAADAGTLGARAWAAWQRVRPWVRGG
jgi:tetratricopeptide (TPR) repeat protein